MPETQRSLLQVSTTLANLIALKEKVLAQGDTWRASATEWNQMCEFSAVTGQALPDEAEWAKASALAFLGIARSRLETMAKALSNVPEPG